MDFRIIAIIIALLWGTASVALAEGRPAGCPKLWCGCYARTLASSDPGPQGNLALNWRGFGRKAEPGCVGCFAVMHRRGGGHVGKVVGYDANGNPIIRSGNTWNRNTGGRRAVADGVYPKRRIVAWRWV